MQALDLNTRDLSQQPICLANDLSFWPVHERGAVVYRLEIPSQRRFYRIGYPEYVFISLLDGNTTIPQACGLAASKLSKQAPLTVAAESIVRWLLANDLAYLREDGPPLRHANRNTTPSPLERLNPFWIKLPLPNTEKWVGPIANKAKPLFRSACVLIGIFVIFVAMVTLVSSWEEFADSISLFHASNWIWLTLTWITLKIVHELAHAAACHYHGGEVGESGFVLILFAPMAFVDVTSCWRMDSRWSRMGVSAAGMYVEILIAAVAMLVWATTDSLHVRYLMHNVVLVAGFSTLLFNANPLMRFDGYYILADWIDIPNLWGEGTRSLQNVMTRIAVGRQSRRSEILGWRKYFVLLYGVAAFLWRLVVCCSLLIVASTMFAGAGIAIAAIGIAFWVGRPARALWRWAVESRQRNPAEFVRAVVIGGVGILAASLFVTCVPIATGQTASAMVRYLPETNVRARADGFVAEIHVSDGDWVREGDLLIKLRNPELTTKLKQLELTWQQNEIRSKQATGDHDAATHRLIRDNQLGLEKQIAVLRRQVEGLRITAPRDGRVIAHAMAEREGIFVREGDWIMNVAREVDKEVVAMIDQDDVHWARKCIGNELTIQAVGYRKLPGTLDRIEPQASQTLQELALAVTHGGPIAVEPVEDGAAAGVRLIQPHFRGRIGLDPSDAIHIAAGLRTDVAVGQRHETIVQRLRCLLLDSWNRARIDVDRGI